MKLPITAAAIREAQQLLDSGDIKGSIQRLRQARESLERLERRLTKTHKHGRATTNSGTAAGEDQAR